MEKKLFLIFILIMLAFLLMNFLVSRIQDKGKRILVTEMITLIFPFITLYILSAIFIFSDLSRNDSFNIIIKILAIIVFIYFNFIIIRRLVRLISNFRKSPVKDVVYLLSLNETYVYDSPNIFRFNVLIEDEELELESEEEDYIKLLSELGMEDERNSYLKFEDKKYKLEIIYYPQNNILVEANLLETKY